MSASLVMYTLPRANGLDSAASSGVMGVSWTSLVDPVPCTAAEDVSCLRWHLLSSTKANGESVDPILLVRRTRSCSVRCVVDLARGVIRHEAAENAQITTWPFLWRPLLTPVPCAPGLACPPQWPLSAFSCLGLVHWHGRLRRRTWTHSTGAANPKTSPTFSGHADTETLSPWTSRSVPTPCDCRFSTWRLYLLVNFLQATMQQPRLPPRSRSLHLQPRLCGLLCAFLKLVCAEGTCPFYLCFVVVEGLHLVSCPLHHSSCLRPDCAPESCQVMRKHAELVLNTFERCWLAHAFHVHDVTELWWSRALSCPGAVAGELSAIGCCWSASSGPPRLPTAAPLLRTQLPETGPWLKCSSSLSPGSVGTYVGLNSLGVSSSRRREAGLTTLSRGAPLPSSQLHTCGVRHATLVSFLGTPELSEASSYAAPTAQQILRNKFHTRAEKSIFALRSLAEPLSTIFFHLWSLIERVGFFQMKNLLGQNKGEQHFAVTVIFLLIEL